jgi:hypothetical protein
MRWPPKPRAGYALAVLVIPSRRARLIGRFRRERFLRVTLLWGTPALILLIVVYRLLLSN